MLRRILKLGACVLCLALIVGCSPAPATADAPNAPRSASALPPATDTALPGAGLGGGTELPSLPNFQEILSFGGGGGGDPGCLHDPGIPTALTIEPEDFRVAENYIDLCLWGVVEPGMSFWVALTSPDGREFRSNTLSEDRERNFEWQGYADAAYQDFAVAQSGLSRAVSVAVSWPANLPEGIWHAAAYVGNTQLTAQASVSRGGKPSIGAINLAAGKEILPVGIDNNLTMHPLRLQDSAQLDVYGVNYPPNAPVYILLYQSIPPEPVAPFQMKLMHTQALLADANGIITAQVPWQFAPGPTYMIMGVSQASMAAHDTSEPANFFGDAPYDYFRVEPSGPVGTCPGATPQRMVVAQKGRVCTQSDAVRLRSSASQSSGVLARLAPGSLFTVIAGPSCADSSSWWQVQTNDGTVGWIAEGGDETDPYFICPLP